MLSDNYIIEGSKGGEKGAHTPVETPNNLLSVAYAKVLIAVAEGELEGNPTGKDIYLNGTPLISGNGDSNFGGVTWEWRKGSVDQTHIPGIPEVSNEINVGVELKQASPWVQQVTKESLSAVRVTLQWPALMQQLSNGDTVGHTIDYAIDLSTNGGPFTLYQQYQVGGKTNGVYERTHRVNLPESDNGWSVRVRRITANATGSLIQDTMNIKSYAEVVDAKQRYPNTALLFVQFDSRLFGGGTIPKISVKTKGRVVRVPANYDPSTRTYSGTWSGDFKWAWTDNPAWVFFDIVTQDRFGLGSRVTVNQVDKWALYEVAQYCDVMVDDGTGSGGLQPRHTCNIYIQSKADAWEVLRDICSIFNGMMYWNGNQFVAKADKLEPVDDIPTFSRSNVVDGEFQYSSSDERTIFTSALVSYDEPTDHYETQVEAVREDSQILRWGGDRQTTMAAIGCTSRAEAQRKGKYTLITNLLNRGVTFKTGLQGLNENVAPGSIIGIADPLISGKPFTGRLIASTPTVVTLDRLTEAKAGDLLFVNLKDGSQQARTIRQVSGRVVTVTTAYSEALPANAVWYLEADDLKSQLFKVVKVTSPDESIYEINAVEYNTSKYAAIDNGARLEPRPTSKVPPSVQQSPSTITITSSSFLEQTMAVPTMTISWPATENAVLYEGEWRIGQGGWVTLGTTGATEFTVRGIYTGKYLARVRAINALGIKSLWKVSETTEILGKTGVPPSITSLTVTPIVFGMTLNWTFPEGAEDTARTEVMYSTSPSFSNAIKLGDFAYPQQVHELNGLAAGVVRFFWARLVDRSGNVGPYFPLSSTNGVQGMSSNDPLEYEKYFLGQIKESALGQELNDRIDLIDGNGPGSVNDRLNEAVTDLEDKISQITDALVYDPNKAYTFGEIVRLGQKLYQAQGNVPAGATPPNPLYWTDVGTILQTANALSTRVEIAENKIEVIDGKVTASASQLSSLQAGFREDNGEGELADALRGYSSAASFAQEVKVRANEQEATVTRLTSLDARVDKNTAGISTLDTVVATEKAATASRLDQLKAGVDGNSAAIGVEVVARVDGDKANTDRIVLTEAKVAENTAKISTVESGLATTDQTVASIKTTVEAVYTINRDDDGEGELSAALEQYNSNARFATETKATANELGAIVRRTETLQASINDVDGKIGDTNAAVQVVSQATANLKGQAEAMWAVKLQVNAQGQYVTAGVGLGIENGPAGLQSTFLVQADKFAVVNGVNSSLSAPFVVTGGQVFIKDAFIANGSITMLKIGDTLQSDNYVQGVSGWRLLKSGTFEINGNVSGQGRMTMTNRSLRVYDGNNVKRVQLGDLQE